MLNFKNISNFIFLSFGISWFFALIIYLLDIKYGSTISIVIVAALYMPGPAIATIILHKLVLKTPLSIYNFRLKDFSSKWLFLYTPLLFISIITIFYIIVFLLGNTLNIEGFGEVNFNSEFIFNELNKLSGGNLTKETFPLPINVYVLMPLGLIGGFISAYSVNLPFMLGEELGWRGFLWNEVKDLGFIKANLIVGFLWGLWHAPVILLGHNYPEYPFLGILMMVIFCIAASFSFSYLRIKTKTIWGPCVIHGMLNATGSLILLFIASENSLLGSIAGIAGSLAFLGLLVFIYLFDKRSIKIFDI